jgi:hypothetical protein
MNMPAPILTTTAALASGSIYSGTTTFCGVPFISMHRMSIGLWRIESGPLNVS